ncbi:MAG: CHAP domain-containing protein [Peptococcaceae bacterium]|jgi:hypothetical protein|nr:CHAP domain-containing protein [Peptococcaceae bacterium]
MGKRILRIVLVLSLTLSLTPTLACAMTGSEALGWALSQVGNMIGNGQCTRLAEAYTWQFFGFFPKTTPKDYPSIDLPDGWEKIKHYPGFIPSPGDIAIWVPGRGSWGWIGDSGHTAIILSATDTLITSVDQNFTTSGNGSPAEIITHTYDSFWGVLRPNFNGLEGHQIPVNDLAESDLLYSTSDWAREGVASAISKGFVSTKIGADFTNAISRAQFCQMAVRWLEYYTGKNIDALLADKGVSRNPNAFSDTVEPDILAAYALGITSGTLSPTDTMPGLFTPNTALSREQAAAIILNTCKAAGMHTGSITAVVYADIGAASSWAIDGIYFCYAKGIMTGTSTSPLRFSPKSIFTKQESMVTFDRILVTTR